MSKSKAVFLDRDGVLNQEIGHYVWTLDKFKLVPGIVETLRVLKESGYLLIVVTNQAGIAKGEYTREDMHKCHDFFQAESGGLIDKFYFAAGHPLYSESLLRKPDSLMWEKAIAKFDIDPSQSWMVGDKERDLIPAKKLGVSTIRILIDGYYDPNEKSIGDFVFDDVKDIINPILKR